MELDKRKRDFGIFGEEGLQEKRIRRMRGSLKGRVLWNWRNLGGGKGCEGGGKVTIIGKLEEREKWIEIIIELEEGIERREVELEGED